MYTEQREREDQLRAKFDKFLAVVDHTEGQMMAFHQIQGYADWLLKRVRGKAAKSWIGFIEEIITSLLEKTEQIHEQHKKEFVEITWDMIQDIIRGIFGENFQPQFGQHPELKIKAHPDFLRIIFADVRDYINYVAAQVPSQTPKDAQDLVDQLIQRISPQALAPKIEIDVDDQRLSIKIEYQPTEPCDDFYALNERIFSQSFLYAEYPNLYLFRIRLLLIAMGAEFGWLDKDDKEYFQFKFPRV